MENIDQSTEQQVWQRVFAKPQTQFGREDLRMLMLSAMETASAYRLLAGTLTGKAKERVKRLWEGEQANIACLRGMQLLSGGTEEAPKMLNAPNEPVKKILEKSYHRTRRAMMEYTARLADPEFGAVFQTMANRAQAHCASIAELMGTIKD